MAMIKRFTEIVAWQKGRELVNEIYRLTCAGAFGLPRGQLEKLQVNYIM